MMTIDAVHSLSQHALSTLSHRSLGDHGIDADEILPNLYQGAKPPEGTAVRDAGFNVLVLCAKEIQNASRYPGVLVLKCPLDDDEEAGISDDEWYRAVYTAVRVASLINQGACVLITCRMGLNRSGIVSALTTHDLTGWPGHVCVGHVKSCRPGALFNKAFVDALTLRLR